MSVLERVSLLNSYQTLLNDDSDFSRFESRLTNFGSGVLFSDMMTKPEFDISGTSGTATITSGEAIITTTRATSSPITGKKTPVRYQLSDTKTLTGLVSGSKIYIEIDQTLVDNPTLIQDTYPSTDYANGLNIGTLTHATSRPTTNTYIPLWELSGIDWTWTDLRSMPKIKGNRIDFVDVDGNISTEGNITAQDITALGNLNATSAYANEFTTPSGGLQKQIDQINIDIGTLQEFLDDSFMLGEPITAGQCVFLENGPATGVATNKQNIGDVAGNTRVSFPVIGTGVASNSLKLSLAKVLSPTAFLRVRLETDNAGVPSGTLVDANATKDIDPNINISDTTGVSLPVSSSPSGKQGVRIYVKTNTTLQSVSIQGGATVCYLQDDSNNTLQQANISAGVATFGYPLVSGTYYRVVCDGGASLSYLDTGVGYPKVKTNIDYISGVTGGTTNSYMYTITGINTGSLSTILTDTTVTFPGSFTVANGTKVHTVVSAVGDVVNASNYYNIGYSTNNTTTRPLNKYETSRGTADNDIFPYISSDLFQDKLLSLTDSDYAYKVDLVGIAIENKGIGTYPKLTIQGINGEQSGLTQDTYYYLGTTGSLSASPGTNSFCVGKGITATKLLLANLFGVNTVANGPLYVTGGSGTTYSTVYIPTCDMEAQFSMYAHTYDNSYSTVGLQMSKDGGSTWINITDVYLQAGYTSTANGTGTALLLKGYSYRTYMSSSYNTQVGTIGIDRLKRNYF